MDYEGKGFWEKLILKILEPLEGKEGRIYYENPGGWEYKEK